MTAAAVFFEVVGDPVGQGAVRAINVAGKARVVQGGTSKHRRELRTWRDRIGDEAAKAALGTLFDEPVGVKADFFLPDTQLAAKKGWRWVFTKKRDDLDHLCRALFDALSGTVVADDGWVSRARLTKS